LFADRVGEVVASGFVDLVDDPTDPRAFTATETDGEGLATRRNELIVGGVLQGFVHDTYTARRMATRSTGSAVRGFKTTPTAGCMAVRLVPGDRSPAELIAGVSNGVLVQEVTGLHSGVNPVSGDFSTGAEGLRIRDGEVAEPIREFTIGSTLQRMLQDVVAVGNDLEWLPMSAAGLTLVIDDVTVSGE
jgi:PmbA protein